MMNTIYRQVELQRATGGQIQVQVCWIPAQFAKQGKVLEIRESESNGCFSYATTPIRGWVVEKVYGRLSTRQELDRQRAERRDLAYILNREETQP